MRSRPARTNRVGRSARQGGVDETAEEQQRDDHDGKQAARFVPGLRREGRRIDPGHGFAHLLVAEKHGPLGFAPRIEEVAVERCEDRWRISVVALSAAAEALENVAAALRAIGDAESGRHDRRRDILQIGEHDGLALHPVHLALLQLQVLRRDLGDRVDPGARRSVGVDENVGRGRGEAKGRYGDDPQRQPDLQVTPWQRPHWRMTRASGAVSPCAIERQNRREGKRHLQPRANVGKFARPFSGNARLRDSVGWRIVAASSLHGLRSATWRSLMLRSRFALGVLALIGLVLGPARADSGTAVSPSVGLAIVDFAYVDTSGEPTDQVAAHQERLRAFMTALRRDFAADGQFHLVPVSCGPVSCMDDGLAPADLFRAASEAGATILVIGGIHKQSTLIQWAKVQAIDIAANRVVFDRLFTFRGDSDEAWERAEAFVSRQIRAALAAS
jgi:hypothetical protein